MKQNAKQQNFLPDLFGEEPEAAKSPEKPQVTPSGSRTLKGDTLKKALEKHAQWLDSRGQKGKRGNFTGYDFRNANLTKVRLAKATLRRANFENANLTGADLAESDLRDAKLKSANLKEANMTRADCRGADFTGVNFTHTEVDLTNFKKAVLENIDFRQANFSVARELSLDYLKAYFDVQKQQVELERGALEQLRQKMIQQFEKKSPPPPKIIQVPVVKVEQPSILNWLGYLALVWAMTAAFALSYTLFTAVDLGWENLNPARMAVSTLFSAVLLAVSTLAAHRLLTTEKPA